MSTEALVITQPDDWHLHLRDGNMLRAVLPETIKHFARALIMPNLVPPVATLDDARNYRERILNAIPHNQWFSPLMTLYLTENINAHELEAGVKAGLIWAVKLYPAGATTNSEAGVKNIEKISHVLEAMERIGIPLCVHGEVTDPEVDIFDREAAFIDRVLWRIHQRFPGLRIVMEHITTRDGIDFISSGEDTLAGTITAHHLIINRNHILAGGIKPHYYCLPVAKRETHRKALVKAATSGHKKFFLGTDSAPHLNANKETSCGCAGCFTATNAIPLLAHVFEAEHALDKLEAFASHNGADFYKIPRNRARIKLEKQDSPLTFPDHIETEDGAVKVFDPGFDVYWNVETINAD